MLLNKKNLLSLAILLLLAFIYNSGLFPERNTESYRVVRVVDGDTVIVDMQGEEKRVRLIGVDCPESVHPDKERNVPYGKIASAFTRSQLEGRYVVLTADVSDTDQYGRLLRYVYLDGVLFNEVLVRQGHALAKSYPPNIAQDSVLQAAQTNEELHEKLHEELHEKELSAWF